MQAQNKPLAEESDKAVPSLESSQRLRLGSGASLFKMLKTSLLKPKLPTEIHSSSISEVQGNSTLAPFIIPGINVKKVNKDYEAFKGSAWVDPVAVPLPVDDSIAQRNGSAYPSPLPVSISVRSDDDLNEQGSGRDRPGKSSFYPPLVKHRSKSSDVVGEGVREERGGKGPGAHSPQSQRKAGVLPPLPPSKRLPLLPPSPAGGGGAPVFHRQGTEVSILICIIIANWMMQREA